MFLKLVFTIVLVLALFKIDAKPHSKGKNFFIGPKNETRELHGLVEK